MGASGPRLQARAAGGWPLEWGHGSLAECSVLCRGVFVRTRARGWANEASMRSHIDSHLAGSLPGDVPNTWMEERQRIRCLVCGLSVSERFGVHPTCRPEARGAAVDQASPMEVDGLPLPTLQEIQSARTPTLRHVPAAARHMWNQLLTRALAAVVHRNDERAWRELLMLAQCVLCAPLRGGRKHKRAAAAFTLDRMQRWQEGERSPKPSTGT